MLNKKNTQNLSPLERFWLDQNQKLIANDGFLDNLGNLFDDKLYFKSKTGKTTLDFSLFDLGHIYIESPALLTLIDKQYTLTLKEYAKLLVINTITPQSVNSALPTFTMMRHIAAFLNTEQERMLTTENIESFHVSFLSQSVTDTRWVTRLSPPSYRATYAYFKFTTIRRNLYALGVEGIIDTNLTKRKIDKTLDYACQSILAISRVEYVDGGSFNALTLDLGQYYVDHLKRIYEKDFLFTLVCQSAIQELVSQEGFDGGSLRYKFIPQTIMGDFVPVQSNPATFSRNNIDEFLRSELFRQYQHHFEQGQSLKESNIKAVVSALGLNLRFDAIEVIRVLMLLQHYPFPAHKNANDIWRDYLLSLGKTEIETQKLNAYTADDVYATMETIVAKHRLTQDQFHLSLNQWAKELVCNNSDITFRELRVQLERVCHAMTSLVVAYTGYRKSEFGFPLNAISVQPNFDILDSGHVPFRFILKWVVPKTGGSTKITREITSQCYQLAAQLDQLLFAPKGAPCLYVDYNKRISGRKTPHESDIYIALRVQANWPHFVHFYQPFVDVREFSRLSSVPTSLLSQTEQSRLRHLSEKYDFNSARSQNLLAASKDTLEGLMRLECTAFIDSRSQERFKQSLIEFHETGSISDAQHRKIITTDLSEETQQWIRSEGCHFDLKAIQDIRNELTSDVLYPTPHAFRHIWAESVLMRYQGDIGAVVQHQFCYLDSSFFMAYLRNKEAKNLMQAARMKVLNSIVDTLLCDTNKIGKEYVGGFSLFVKKAASLVEAVSDNEVRALRDRIAGRVISIQPSRFATCVPREGAESRAKCAEMGEINPHNAKPSFCLGCTNAIITSGNIAGIWATIQPFVKECLNDDIMGFMVESHLDTLHSANRRIKELAPFVKNSSMDKILFYINEAIKSVDRKLEAEKGLYE